MSHQQFLSFFERKAQGGQRFARHGPKAAKTAKNLKPKVAKVLRARRSRSGRLTVDRILFSMGAE